MGRWVMMGFGSASMAGWLAGGKGCSVVWGEGGAGGGRCAGCVGDSGAAGYWWLAEGE